MIGKQLTLIPNICDKCGDKFDFNYKLKECAICKRGFCSAECDEEGRSLEDDIFDSKNFYYVCGQCTKGSSDELLIILSRINELKKMYETSVRDICAEFFPLKDRLRKLDAKPSSSMNAREDCKGISGRCDRC